MCSVVVAWVDRDVNLPLHSSLGQKVLQVLLLHAKSVGNSVIMHHVNMYQNPHDLPLKINIKKNHTSPGGVTVN